MVSSWWSCLRRVCGAPEMGTIHPACHGSREGPAQPPLPTVHQVAPDQVNPSRTKAITVSVHVGPPHVTCHSDDQVLVTGHDATMSRHSRTGYFVADTRLVSAHAITMDDQAPILVNSGAVSHFGARFEFTNPALSGPWGDIEEHTLHLRLDRSVGNGVHEDYDLVNFGSDTIRVRLEIILQSDFADLMDVKSGQLVRRGTIQSHWDADAARTTTTYRHDDFVRSVVVQAQRCDSPPQHANGRWGFTIALDPGASWHTCMHWLVQLDEQMAPSSPLRACHQLGHAATEPDQRHDDFVTRAASVTTGDHLFDATLSRAVHDLAGLRLLANDQQLGASDDGLAGWVPAAGVPWFVAPFGRDSLVMALQTMLLSPEIAVGTLKYFGDLQATSDDPDHDEQPGRIVHELRQGELAHFGLIPQTPYFGTADAPSLYVQAAGQLWSWTGSTSAIQALTAHVDRALAWIDDAGDLDGDGLQEYRTRAGDWGYRNQGWKDSGQAIVGATGVHAGLPIATCELQGYVVAAKRAWARVCEQALDDPDRAERLRAEADQLAQRIEEQLWWEAEGTYYLGLDGDKQPIESVASNAGHLLWSGAVAPERARATADRLLADDMFTGWGVRTLSSDHPAYNPLSYQRGSVWPHDNAMLVAGLHRYGLHDHAHRITRGLVDAAGCFAQHRLPELFAGLPRDNHALPVQYLGANVPQGWASGAVIHMVSAMLGPRPDPVNGHLVVDPHLPHWLDELHVDNVRVGSHSANLRIRRDDTGMHVLSDAHDLDVSQGDAAPIDTCRP